MLINDCEGYLVHSNVRRVLQTEHPYVTSWKRGMAHIRVRTLWIISTVWLKGFMNSKQLAQKFTKPF